MAPLKCLTSKKNTGYSWLRATTLQPAERRVPLRLRLSKAEITSFHGKKKRKKNFIMSLVAI